MLLKLSHILFNIVSLIASPQNICLDKIIIEWCCNQLYAPSSISFSSFMTLSYYRRYVSFVAFHKNSLIRTPEQFFLKLLCKCLLQILYSYYGQFSANVCTKPYQQKVSNIHVELERKGAHLLTKYKVTHKKIGKLDIFGKNMREREWPRMWKH